MPHNKSDQKKPSDLKEQAKDIKNAHRINEQLLQIMDIIQIGVIIYRADASIYYSNPAAREIIGVEENQLSGLKSIGSGWQLFQKDGIKIRPEDHPVNQVITKKRPLLNMVLGVMKPDLDFPIWTMINAHPIYQDDEIINVIVIFVDISEIKSATEALRHSQVSMQAILDKTPLGVCVTDEHGIFESVNESYCRFYGYLEQELLGHHFTMVVPEENKEQLKKLHDDFIAGEKELRGEWDVVVKSGEIKSIIADAALIQNASGRPKKVTFVMDITREKQFQRKLEEVSQTDSLTKTVNRKCLSERLNIEIERAVRYQHPLSIIMLDIDHFKSVNDNFGHIVGDEVLIEITKAVRMITRKPDTLGRYGGEEFLIILPDTDLAGATTLAERMRQSIESLSFPHVGLKTSSSFGVAVHAGEDPLDFISIADRRLYIAKQSGRNRVVNSSH